MLYAVYKGDEFVDVGTAEELAERLGYASVKKISWRCTPSAKMRKKHNQDNREYLQFFRICWEYNDGSTRDIEVKKDDIED